MTQPSFTVRIAGRPLVCVALLVVYGILLWRWLEGGIRWWLALIVISMAMRTVSAYGQLKRYNTWLAAWNAMGEDDEPSPQRQQGKPKARGSRWLTIAAALLATVIPMFGTQQPPASKLLWCAAVLILLWKLVLKLWRTLGFGVKAMNTVKADVEAVKDAPVAWLLPRAASSPSRMEVMRRLPEYSARLIDK